MKILKINITEFAALRELSLDLDCGMNIIEGANESGKSSIMGFIKFMLYGFPRKASGDEVGERERGISWSGRRAAGSMTIEVKSGVWRIERDGIIQTRGSRESYIESLNIINTETGETLPSGTCPGEFFLKIPVSVFSSTCSIEQLRGGNIASEDVGSNIENMLFSADETLNAQKALDRLGDARKQLLYKNERGGKIFDLRIERQRLRERLSEAVTNTKNMIAKEIMAEHYKAQSDRARENLRELEELHDSSEIILAVEKFDRVKLLRQQRDRLAEELKNLEKNSFAASFVPSRKIISEMNILSGRLSRECNDMRRAEAELERLMNSPTYNKALAEKAEELYEKGMGSDESLLSGYGMLKKRVKKAKSAAKALFTLGAILVVAGGALVFFMPVAGIPAVVLGIGGIVGGAIAMSASKKRMAEVMAYLAELGIENDNGEEGIRRYADSCFDALEEKKEYLTLIEARQGVCQVCRKNLDAAISEGNSLLKKTATFADGNRNDVFEVEKLILDLAESSDRVTSFCNLSDKIKLALESAEKNIAELDSYLAKYDEALLRRKCEALEETDPITFDEYRTRRTALMREIKTADDKKNDIEIQLSAMDASSDKPRRLTLLLEENQKELEECNFRFEAIKLASEALAEASGQLRLGVTPKLRKDTSKTMSEITNGKYSELGVSSDMEVTVTADNVTRPIASMSVGTRDVAYIALRISLMKLLCSEELPPLMLDEALAHVDDTRAENMLSMLKRHTELGAQCLLFTCQSREGDSMGEGARLIKL